MTSRLDPGAARPAGRRSARERADHGRVLRWEVPRGSHGDWTPSPGRPDPVAILAAQAASQPAERVAIRYERMLRSPFAFFRGAAAVMAADLRDAPRTGVLAQLNGDAHLANFGGFGSPDRGLVFDLEDFDETLRGPWEWDVARLSASVEIAGRELAYKPALRHATVRSAVRAYREAMREFATLRPLDVWCARVDATAALERVGRGVSRRARRPSPAVMPGAPVPDALVGRMLEAHAAGLRADRRLLLSRYRFVPGTGRELSVGGSGARAWTARLAGRDEHDPLTLEFRQSGPSVLEPYAGQAPQAAHGQRVVEGRWLTQATGDALLGWLEADDGGGRRCDLSARRVRERLAGVDLEAMRPGVMHAYGQLAGWTLARAHARSGDAVAIGAYLGSGEAFDRSMAAYADAYAEQNERDLAALARSVTDGAVAAHAAP